ESAPEIPIVLHLDHGDKPETCFMAIELGFTSVMMDGSLLADGKTPSDYEYNIEVTRQVAEAAHAQGVSVEGELGTLGGIEESQQGIRHGVRKVNVDTDGRLAITAALREALNANPSEFDPRAFFKPAREAMKQVVMERLTQFGAAGHARDYEVLPLSEMAK